MTPPLFLVDDVPDTPFFTLHGPEGHHAATVQRLRTGEALMLGDGRGTTVHAVVTAVGKGSLEVALGTREYQRRPDPRLVVVQGIAKGDRGERAVQAMTEVGVDMVVPWAASRSVVRWDGERGAKGRQRWSDTVREAAKQSRRGWVPEVAEVASTATVAQRLSWAAGALVLDEAASLRLATVALPGSGDLLIVVGPEGGIDPQEHTQFASAGATRVRLGDSVLRTSTAGVAALAVLAVRLGRW